MEGSDSLLLRGESLGVITANVVAALDPGPGPQHRRRQHPPTAREKLLVWRLAADPAAGRSLQAQAGCNELASLLQLSLHTCRVP